VIIDPLMGHIDMAFASINDQAMRQALFPLQELARDTQCTLLVIRHLNKSGAVKALYRGSGSIGIIGCSRGAFIVARSPDDPSLRVLACLKLNVAEQPPSLGFRILCQDPDRPKVEWTGIEEYSADDLLAVATKKTSAQDRAVAFLQTQLQDGRVEYQTLLVRAKSADLSERTLFRAKKVAKVSSVEEGPPAARKHYWTLDKPDSLAGILASPVPDPANSR